MVALKHNDLYIVESPGTVKKFKPQEDTPMYTDSADSLEEFKAIFRAPSDDTKIITTIRRDAKILEDHLSDMRQELERLTLEHNRLLEIAKRKAVQLATIQPLPGLFLARIEEIVHLVEQRKDGYHRTSEPVTSPEGLDKRFNQAIAQLRLILEQEHILENQELHETITNMQSTLAAKREEVLQLQVENEQLNQRLESTLDAIQRFNNEAAAHEERIIRLQQYMKEAEAKHQRLFVASRTMKARKTADNDAFTFFTGNKSDTKVKSNYWVLPLSMLIIGMVLGTVLTIVAQSWIGVYGVTDNTDSKATSSNTQSVSEDVAIDGTIATVNRERLSQTKEDMAQNLSFGLDLVSIPGGTFIMGGNNRNANTTEKPAHKVYVPGFLLSRYEITFNQYDMFAKATGREFPSDQGWGRGQRPVINVNWEDANAYTKWLSVQTGKKYRLPTESEWEYAISDGNRQRFWWGDTFVQGREVCFNCGTAWDGKSTAPIGSMASNPRGLYDMGGNVMEWVGDCATNTNICDMRVVRGGAYNKPYDSMRNTARRAFAAVDKLPMVGFRVVREWVRGS